MKVRENTARMDSMQNNSAVIRRISYKHDIQEFGWVNEVKEFCCY